MKTTVKLDQFRAVVIEPDRGGVKLTINVGHVPMGNIVLTPEQAGAVLFAIEQAGEAAEIRQHARAA